MFYDYVIFFFFSSRRRHTRFKCDWSSDVCSSDLIALLSPRGGLVSLVACRKNKFARGAAHAHRQRSRATSGCSDADRRLPWLLQLDRKSVVEGKRVDLGGRRIIKKKKRKRRVVQG